MTTSLDDIRLSAVGEVRLDVAHGNLDLGDDDAVERYCSEAADGHHDVIYTFAVRELFARGDLDDFLDEVDGVSVGTINAALTDAAFFAVRAAYVNAVDVVREDRDTTV